MSDLRVSGLVFLGARAWGADWGLTLVEDAGAVGFPVFLM